MRLTRAIFGLALSFLTQPTMLLPLVAVFQIKSLNVLQSLFEQFVEWRFKPVIIFKLGKIQCLFV